MSSSPPTEIAANRPARWLHPAGWPLRTRIVAILVVLLTAAVRAMVARTSRVRRVRRNLNLARTGSVSSGPA